MIDLILSYEIDDNSSIFVDSEQVMREKVEKSDLDFLLKRYSTLMRPATFIFDEIKVRLHRKEKEISEFLNSVIRDKIIKYHKDNLKSKDDLENDSLECKELIHSIITEEQIKLLTYDFPETKFHCYCIFSDTEHSEDAFSSINLEFHIESGEGGWRGVRTCAHYMLINIDALLDENTWKDSIILDLEGFWF